MLTAQIALNRLLRPSVEAQGLTLATVRIGQQIAAANNTFQRRQADGLLGGSAVCSKFRLVWHRHNAGTVYEARINSREESGLVLIHSWTSVALSTAHRS